MFPWNRRRPAEFPAMFSLAQALCCIVSVTLEDSADTTGQLALAAPWLMLAGPRWRVP